MYYSAKHFYDTKVNFKEILNDAVAKRRLVRAIAYVIKTEIKEESNFHDALNKLGIEVKAKDIQIFQGGAKKGDWDIGIAMDAVRLSNKVDTVVLVSGDGDFAELLRYLKSHGCRCEVIAFNQTASKFIKAEADDFLDLTTNTKKYLIKKTNRKNQILRKPIKSSVGAKPIKRNSTVRTQKPAGSQKSVRTQKPVRSQKPVIRRPPKLNKSEELDPVQEAIMKANMNQVKSEKKSDKK